MSKYTPNDTVSTEQAREWIHQGKENPFEVSVSENDRDNKEWVLQNPTPLTYVGYTESCTVMLDWFMEMAIQGDHNLKTKTDIAEITGISRPHVSKHLHRFVEMGLIEAVGEGNTRYRVPEDDDAIIYDFIALNQRMSTAFYDSAE